MTFFAGFIKYVLPWLFGIVCLSTVALDVFGVFFKERTRLVGILSCFFHVALIVCCFLLGTSMHFMVLVLFSSVLLTVAMEYIKYFIVTRRGVREEENDL